MAINYMSDRLKKFETLCYTPEEQTRIEQLNESIRALKETKSASEKAFAWNSAKALMGSPIGAYGAVREAYKSNKAFNEYNKINLDLESIRDAARNRCDKIISEFGNTVSKDTGKDEFGYGRY